MAWADVLRHAVRWHGGVDAAVTAAPMLAVAATAPAVAQGGRHYLRRLDRLLRDAARNDGAAAAPPSLEGVARAAASFRDAVLVDPGSDSDAPPPPGGAARHLLTPRERWHAHALHQLLQDNHWAAMGAYLRLLELHPGDLLGLSLALDVAHALGSAEAALR